MAGGVSGTGQPARVFRVVEQPHDVVAERFIVGEPCQQTVLAVGEDRRHSARLGRHDRQTAGKRLEHRRRHVVDIRALNVDVVRGVETGDLLRLHPADERDVLEAEIRHERAQVGLLRSAADERERSLGPAVLDDSKRADRRGDVVERLEIPRGHQPGAERIARAELEALQVDDVGDDRGGDAEAAKDVNEEARWHDVLVDGGDGLPGDGGPLQVVRRLTTAVVQDDRFAQRPSHQDRRQRGEQKRRVGRREHMHDVRMSQLPHQERQVSHLVHACPQVFHPGGEPEASRRHRIDRHEPRVHVGVVAPGVEKTIGLNSLSPEDSERGGDERDAKSDHTPL